MVGSAHVTTWRSDKLSAHLFQDTHRKVGGGKGVVNDKHLTLVTWLLGFLRCACLLFNEELSSAIQQQAMEHPCRQLLIQHSMTHTENPTTQGVATLGQLQHTQSYNYLPLKGVLYYGDTRGALVIEVTEDLRALTLPTRHMTDTCPQGRKKQLELLQLGLEV